jgi:hypothetical protein
MLTVNKSKITISYDILNEYCNALSKSIKKQDIMYIEYKSGFLTFYAEDNREMGGIGISVILTLPADGSSEDFSAGIEADRFISLVKKLYEGNITISFKKSCVEIKEDNLKAQFARVASKPYIRTFQPLEIDGPRKDWIIASLTDCLTSIAETSKSDTYAKMQGILFDNNKDVVRVGKFSNSSLYISSKPSMFSEDYRFLFPDLAAIIAKSLGKIITKVLVLNNVVGFQLQSGTYIYMPMPMDTYPQNYVEFLRLSSSSSLIPDTSTTYEFDSASLINAVDIVASVLGDTDSWIYMETIGRSEGNLVWKVSGRNFKGTEIEELITSTDGPLVEKFSINKSRTIKALSLFTDKVSLINLDASIAGLVDLTTNRVALLVKAKV